MTRRGSASRNKSRAEPTTVFVHDAFGQVAAEYNSDGVIPACATCCLTYDQIGSVRMITDQHGNVIAGMIICPMARKSRMAMQDAVETSA
jgi:hypothetical protein